MKNGIVLLSVIVVAFFAQIANSECIGTANLNGKIYFVDLIVNGNSAKVWLRVKQNTCSTEDINLLSLKALKVSFKQAGEMICRNKKILDDGRTIIGCSAAIGTGACAIFAAPAGVGFLCAVAFESTSMDCVESLIGLIASKLGYNEEWSFVLTESSISSGQKVSAIINAIDIACADSKKSQK